MLLPMIKLVPSLYKMVNTSKDNELMQYVKTSQEWYQEYGKQGVTIVTPTGWDESRFTYSWKEELIDRQEFERRLSDSEFETSMRSL